MSSLAILTGHSQGLGKAILSELLNKEYQVIGLSRKSSGVSHPNLKEISLDLSDLTLLQSSLDQVFPEGEFEEILLINNAAWIGDIKPVEEISSETMLKMHSLNYLAPAILIKELLSRFASESVQKIICNISSGLAYRAESGLSGYCTSKSALAMLSEVLAKEASPETRILSVAPGVVDTPMQGDLRNANPDSFPLQPRFQDLKDSGALFSSEEAAKRILYILDHKNEFQEVVQDIRNVTIN